MCVHLFFADQVTSNGPVTALFLFPEKKDQVEVSSISFGGAHHLFCADQVVESSTARVFFCSPEKK